MELKADFEVRGQVFVEKQGISQDIEFDGYGQKALHMVVGKPALNTLRCRDIMSPGRFRHTLRHLYRDGRVVMHFGIPDGFHSEVQYMVSAGCVIGGQNSSPKTTCDSFRTLET
ncbi:MAG TPA: hypothetical protein G4N93_02680 [Dehalococcoidia bacterium]|nr:hypothetical protein [Dehalococcoidia bacterium]